MLEKNLDLLINILEENYDSLKLKNLFEKESNKKGLLKFGYVCPGAIKTVQYIKSNVKSERSNNIYKKIIRYTDALFFIELIELYTKYIDRKLVNKINEIIDGKSCLIAKVITKIITKQFSLLPKKIAQNLPDNFYQMRHQTLICSQDKQLVKNRINFLKKLYKGVNICDGKRDGVSGCRDCCGYHFDSFGEYQTCVDSCMNI